MKVLLLAALVSLAAAVCPVITVTEAINEMIAFTPSESGANAVFDFSIRQVQEAEATVPTAVVRTNLDFDIADLPTGSTKDNQAEADCTTTTQLTVRATVPISEFLLLTPDCVTDATKCVWSLDLPVSYTETWEYSATGIITFAKRAVRTVTQNFAIGVSLTRTKVLTATTASFHVESHVFWDIASIVTELDPAPTTPGNLQVTVVFSATAEEAGQTVQLKDSSLGTETIAENKVVYSDRDPASLSIADTIVFSVMSGASEIGTVTATVTIFFSGLVATATLTDNTYLPTGATVAFGADSADAPLPSMDIWSGGEVFIQVTPDASTVPVVATSWYSLAVTVETSSSCDADADGSMIVFDELTSTHNHELIPTLCTKATQPCKGIELVSDCFLPNMDYTVTALIHFDIKPAGRRAASVNLESKATFHVVAKKEVRAIAPEAAAVPTALYAILGVAVGVAVLCLIGVVALALIVARRQ